MRIAIALVACLAGGVALAGDAPDPAKLFPFHNKKESGWGFIDVKGKIVVKPTWERAFGFSEGLARVKRGGLFGWVDAAGTEVIAPAWQSAGDFHDGLAPVERRKDEFKGWIDKSGNLV